MCCRVDHESAPSWRHRTEAPGVITSVSGLSARGFSTAAPAGVSTSVGSKMSSRSVSALYLKATRHTAYMATLAPPLWREALHQASTLTGFVLRPHQWAVCAPEDDTQSRLAAGHPRRGRGWSGRAG